MSQTLYDVLLKVDFTQIDGATVSVKKLNDANNDAAKGMKAVSEAASDAVEPLKKVASAHAGVNRELIVLGHEAMVGNWSRFGGSMLVLGERTNALGAIFGALATPVGAAAVAIVGAIAAVGVAFVQAHKEAKEFASALYLTNNYAGLTTSSMHSLADTLSNEVNSSYGTAFHAVLNLAKAGQYTKEQLALLAPIVINDSRMSGIAIDKVADSYANLARSPTKFMEAFNESHHVFTPKQQEQIRLLEETGRSQEAVTLALKSYTEYQKGPGKKAIEENLSLMDKEIIGLGLMWDAFKRFTGAEKVTPMDQLKELNKEIDTLQAKVGDLSKHSAHSMAMPGDVSDLKNLLDKRKKLMLEIAKDDKENRERANDSLKSQLYQEGSDYLTGLGVKGARSLKIELEKFDKEVKNIRLSNPDSDLLDPEYLKAARQKVIDANTPKRKDPKEIHMAQVDKPASDPYEVWNKSLEKLLDNAEHFSELKKAQIELAHIDEEVATKNAQIDKENAARKEFNEANAVYNCAV